MFKHKFYLDSKRDWDEENRMHITVNNFRDKNSIRGISYIRAMADPAISTSASVTADVNEVSNSDNNNFPNLLLLLLLSPYVRLHNVHSFHVSYNLLI